MQSHTVRRITSAHAAFSLHALTTRYLTTRPSSLRPVGLPVRGTLVSRYVLSLHQIQRLTNGSLTQTFPNPASTTSPERSEDMCPSRPCLRLLCPHLVLLLSLLLLAGLAGCGPASSDNAPGVESRASVSRPPLSKQGPAPGINPLTPVTPAANPVSLASANGTGAVDRLVVPAWLAKELASPDVRVRLRALETWAQSAPPGAVDPLIQALNGKDERQVRAKELIEEEENQDLDEEEENQVLDEEEKK